MIFGIFAILSAVISLTNDDYVALEQTMNDFIAQNPKSRVPKLIRTAFHDVQDYNPKDKNSASHGCLLEKRFLDAPINEFVKDEIVALNTWVNEKLPSKKFPLGDVFAMAGKVAAEWDLPCLDIKFRYGRSPCTDKDQLDLSLPNENINNMTTIKKFTTKLGLTTNELAILIAGAHGTAFAKTTHWNFYFAKTNSGRFAIDMVFYPSTLESLKDEGSQNLIFADSSAKTTEAYLIKFVDKPSSEFEVEYAKAFGKMLEIGADTEDLKPYSPPSKARCSTTISPVASPTISISSMGFESNSCPYLSMILLFGLLMT